jgi:putative hydrolase of the HAD superfamily
MSPRITSVIFDFGGVLGMPQDPVWAQAMADMCGLPLPALIPLYTRDRLELDRGTVSSAGYWGRILAQARKPATADLVDRLVRADFASWIRVNSRVVGWSARLRREGIRTAILSNMPQDILDAMWKEPGLQWMADFQARVFSCEVGLVKPEPEIYRRCLEAMVALPAETVFLDDVPANVEGARALGIQGLLFRSPREAADEIARRWGLPVESLREGCDA